MRVFKPSMFAMLALLLAPVFANASIIVYTTQADFLAAAANAATDSFNDLQVGTEYATPLARTAGAFGYSVTVGPTSDFFTASDGGSDVWLSTNVGTDTMAFGGFVPGVNAAGGFFFGTDIAGNATSVPGITITATDSDGTVTDFLLDPTAVTFLGFVSTGDLSSLTVSLGDVPGAWATVNDFTLGGIVESTVPEPASVAIVMQALWLLAFTRHRRKRQA